MIDIQNLAGMLMPGGKLLERNLPIRDRLNAACDWILEAYHQAGDGGISKGYSLARGRWSPSYPETTGYTIPTLLNAAGALDRPDLQDIAICLADYLLRQVTEDGAVVHWQDSRHSDPIVFDTGQVIFGWLAAFIFTQNEKYLAAAEKAGKWLLSVQDAQGSWVKGQYLNVVKVIDTRVAWALIQLGIVANQEIFFQSACRNLDWALAQQANNGWFNHCAFQEGSLPITHTLVYTAEGLLESGLLLQEDRYINAARKTAESLISKVKPDGSLPGAFRSNWEPALRSSCLTGNCQAAGLWLNLFRQDGQKKYLDTARRVLAFVAGLQPINKTRREIHGGIAGSHPIYGEYERFQFPNWAAKFFIDAMLLLDDIETGSGGIIYVG